MLRFTLLWLLFVSNACLPVHAQAVNRFSTRANQQPKTTVKSKDNKAKTTTAPTNDATGWTDKDRENFLRVCEPATGFSADSAASYCHCLLQKVEKLYPIPADADKNLTAEKARELAKECLAQQSNNRTGWNNAERTAFMNECKSKTKNFGLGKTEAYCSCIMQKFEKAYPNPLDMSKMTIEEINKWAEDCRKQ